MELANVDIPKGSFVGFYTGTFSTEQVESLYAAQVDDMFIYPFADERAITVFDRNRRPLANMNEPLEHTHANCCMIVQDFLPHEVLDVPHTEDSARFFRGLVCFTCEDVKKEQELTWHYGRHYASHREQEGYKAGKPCKALLDKEVFMRRSLVFLSWRMSLQRQAGKALLPMRL